MLGLDNFRKIQEYKKLGISKLKTSDILSISYGLVNKWWNKTEDEYNSIKKEHEFVLDNYREFIIEILKITPQISNTVLLKRIEDEFNKINVPRSTCFRYIKNLRSQVGIPKPKRKYKVRLETEPGFESQVDFGQYTMKSSYNKNIRIYFFCMTLSFSRMKFAYFSVDPFDAKKVICAHRMAFRYFGGRTQMIVYDQDKSMFISENLGDIICVKEFEKFVKETGFSIFLCHGYDPETKGKVEKSVDYVKHQFLEGRLYYGIDRLNAECIEWLDRSGNGTINATTKKIPREIFKEEHRFLKKVYEIKDEEVAVVRLEHDCAIYKDNFYKLPMIKLDNLEKVRVEKYEDDLLIFNPFTDDLICKHKIVKGKGHIIAVPKEFDIESGVDDELFLIFKKDKEAILFLNKMRMQKPRYAYMQCRKIQSIRKVYSDKRIIEGMKYCLSKNDCTFSLLISYLIYKYGTHICEKIMSSLSIHRYDEKVKIIKEELDG